MHINTTPTLKQWTVLMRGFEVTIRLHEYKDELDMVGYCDGPRLLIHCSNHASKFITLHHELAHMFVWLTHGLMGPHLDRELLAQTMATFAVLMHHEDYRQIFDDAFLI
jgi:hypothetical protein